MKNIVSLTVLLLFISFSFTSVKRKDVKIRTVVIDVGHGGKDTGCHGSSAKEKEVALKVAL
ncbi:MAG: N-acetylmuramoyl-L-alanine amidase, partial [Rufibacter sp.]